jgi:hypothetical protein
MFCSGLGVSVLVSDRINLIVTALRVVTFLSRLCDHHLHPLTYFCSERAVLSDLNHCPRNRVTLSATMPPTQKAISRCGGVHKQAPFKLFLQQANLTSNNKPLLKVSILFYLVLSKAPFGSPHAPFKQRRKNTTTLQTTFIFYLRSRDCKNVSRV